MTYRKEEKTRKDATQLAFVPVTSGTSRLESFPLEDASETNHCSGEQDEDRPQDPRPLARRKYEKIFQEGFRAECGNNVLKYTFLYSTANTVRM